MSPTTRPRRGDAAEFERFHQWLQAQRPLLDRCVLVIDSKGESRLVILPEAQGDEGQSELVLQRREAS